MIKLSFPPSSADQFVRAAARWQETFKKDVSVVLRQQSRSILTNPQRTGVVDLTPPTVGLGDPGSASAQRKAGETAVARDIGYVFVSARSAVKKAKQDDARAAGIFSRLLRSNENEAALAMLRHGGGQRQIPVKAHNRKGGVIVTGYQQTRTTPQFSSLNRITQISSYPDKSLHRSARNNRGRINFRKPSSIVSDAGSLSAYIKTKQAMVGFHKSGWKKSAAAVGVSVPAFVARHNAPGRVIDNFAQAGPRFGITFINAAPSIAAHNRDLSIAARAIGYAAARIDRAIQGFRRRTQRL